MQKQTNKKQKKKKKKKRGNDNSSNDNDSDSKKLYKEKRKKYIIRGMNLIVVLKKQFSYAVYKSLPGFNVTVCLTMSWEIVPTSD